MDVCPFRLVVDFMAAYSASQSQLQPMVPGNQVPSVVVNTYGLRQSILIRSKSVASSLLALIQTPHNLLVPWCGCCTCCSSSPKAA